MADKLKIKISIWVQYNEIKRDIIFNVTVTDQEERKGHKEYTIHEWDGFEVPILAAEKYINWILAKKPFHEKYGLLDRLKGGEKPTYQIIKFNFRYPTDLAPAYIQNLKSFKMALEELKQRGEIEFKHYG